MNKTNREGMTWSEWAYAATIPEWIGPFSSDHAATGHSEFLRKERKAWRNGEDPTEWRAALERRS